MTELKKEFEDKFGVDKHHEETCDKAMKQFVDDMKSIRCQTGEQGVLNPTMVKALTFFRYYEDITTWIEQKIDEACKKQREICAKEYSEYIEAIEKHGKVVFDEGKMLKVKSPEAIILNAPSPKESDNE